MSISAARGRFLLHREGRDADHQGLTTMRGHPTYQFNNPGPSGEDDDVVSSNLVMSDRRVSRQRVLGQVRSAVR